MPSGNRCAARLPARAYYGSIVVGVLLGATVCAAAGWVYVDSSAASTTGRRIWDGVAEQFVVPICVMIGATFGGILGVAAAIGLDLGFRRRMSN